MKPSVEDITEYLSEQESPVSSTEIAGEWELNASEISHVLKRVTKLDGYHREEVVNPENPRGTFYYWDNENIAEKVSP